MIPVDEAQRRILGALVPLPAETCALSAALGRVLAEPVRSTLDLPRFDQSAVDGYAVRVQDIAHAPCELPVAQTIAAAARSAAPQLAPGTAARIFTGGWLPLGADTVVRQELTTRSGDRVTVQRALPPATDLRFQGEELRAGDLVIPAGRRITPGVLGAIAMAGVQQVTVHRRPRIRLLVSGDEVAPPGAELASGQIPDANGPLLLAYLRSWGYTDVVLHYVDDRFDSVREAIGAAFDDADLVVTSGGVSVGDHDHIPAAARALGAQELLWKVAQKPGMPLFVAQRGACLLFGLPGNPASVLVNLLAHLRPALARLDGLDPAPGWHSGRLAARLHADPEKTLWQRMRRSPGEDGATLLQPLGKQASHMLSNLADAQVLVRVPPAPQAWEAGSVLWWSSLEGTD